MDVVTARTLDKYVCSVKKTVTESIDKGSTVLACHEHHFTHSLFQSSISAEC